MASFDENIGGDEQTPQVQPSHLENETPMILSYLFEQGVLVLQTHGWYLLIGIIVAIYLKNKYLPNIKRQLKERTERLEHVNQDPGTVRQRQEQLDAVRRRMQEEHDVKAARFAEEQTKREEAKRKEKIEDWDKHQQGKGYRSKHKQSELPQKPGTSSSANASGSNKYRYRNTDNSPLMGGGGGSSYRPARKGPSGGG